MTGLGEKYICARCGRKFTKAWTDEESRAEAEQLCKHRPSYLSYVVLAGLQEIRVGYDAVEKAMEDASQEQSARLFRRVEYLAVIGNIAPMLGLLGTVYGILLAFKKLADTPGAADAARLADGIYLALVTTVEGLIVAIPAAAPIPPRWSRGRATPIRGG